MRFRRLATVAIPVIATVTVAGCGSTATPSIPPSSRLIHVPGLPAGKIMLSALGAQRIGLRTSQARLTVVPAVKQVAPAKSPAKVKPGSRSQAKPGSSTSGKPISSGQAKPSSTSHAKAASPQRESLVTVPYSAVVYAPTGKTYVFSNIGRLTYTEVSITINHIDGEVVFLTSGVKPGTPIVTVGAEELFGVQSGVLAQT